jgi:hypothetical protein
MWSSAFHILDPSGRPQPVTPCRLSPPVIRVVRGVPAPTGTAFVALRLAVTVALALVIGGCGGGASTNGLEKRSVAEVQNEAAHSRLLRACT